MNKSIVIKAIRKDIKILKNQLKIVFKLVDSGLGQFLYIGSSKWSGDSREVARFLKDMIDFLNNSIISIKQEKKIKDPIEFMLDLYKKKFSEDSDVLVFFNGVRQTCIGCEINHTVFANLMKIEQENSEC